METSHWPFVGPPKQRIHFFVKLRYHTAADSVIPTWASFFESLRRSTISAKKRKCTYLVCSAILLNADGTWNWAEMTKSCTWQLLRIHPLDKELSLATKIWLSNLSTTIMHLMYTLNEDGKRIYTLQVSWIHCRKQSRCWRVWVQKKTSEGKITKSAHPARFSPDDKVGFVNETMKVQVDISTSSPDIELPSRKDLESFWLSCHSGLCKSSPLAHEVLTMI